MSVKVKKEEMVQFLAPEHKGMRVDYTGLLQTSIEHMQKVSPLSASSLVQLQAHLQELGSRFYQGDLAVVDEFLQLYCIEEDARKALVPQKPASTPSVGM